MKCSPAAATAQSHHPVECDTSQCCPLGCLFGLPRGLAPNSWANLLVWGHLKDKPTQFHLSNESQLLLVNGKGTKEQNQQIEQSAMACVPVKMLLSN